MNIYVSWCLNLAKRCLHLLTFCELIKDVTKTFTALKLLKKNQLLNETQLYFKWSKAVAGGQFRATANL
jgi:hypothetical protein